MTLREVVLSLLALAMIVAGAAFFLHQKRRSASAAQSLRAMMQWSIGLQLHLMENNNTFPQVGDRVADPANAAAWYVSLPRYLAIRSPVADVSLRNRDALAGPLAIWVDPAYRGQLEQSGGFVFTYAVNRHLQPDIRQPAIRVSGLAAPAATLFMVETAGTDPGVVPATAAFRYRRAGGTPAAHALFCDGHAALVDEKTIKFSPTWPEAGLLDGMVVWSPRADAPEPDLWQLAP